MHNKSLKLQPSSSSSANGHAATHEENGRNHEDLLALSVAFNAEAMHLHQPHLLCQCSTLSVCCYPFSSKTFSVKKQATNGKRRPLLHLLLLVYMNCQDDHNTMRTIQHLDLSRLWPLEWSGTVGKRAPLLQCSDTVCLSSIKTSKIHGTSETCTTCKSLRGLTFRDPGPRWNHRSSTYLSNTLALNIPK